MEGGESGKAIITPGQIDKSYLADLVLGKVRRPMPPKKEPQLSPEQVELISRWIEEGATGPAPGKDLSILATLNVPDLNPAIPREGKLVSMICRRGNR